MYKFSPTSPTPPSYHILNHKINAFHSFCSSLVHKPKKTGYSETREAVKLSIGFSPCINERFKLCLIKNLAALYRDYRDCYRSEMLDGLTKQLPAPPATSVPLFAPSLIPGIAR